MIIEIGSNAFFFLLPIIDMTPDSATAHLPPVDLANDPNHVSGYNNTARRMSLDDGMVGISGTEESSSLPHATESGGTYTADQKSDLEAMDHTWSDDVNRKEKAAVKEHGLLTPVQTNPRTTPSRTESISRQRRGRSSKAQSSGPSTAGSPATVGQYGDENSSRRNIHHPIRNSSSPRMTKRKAASMKPSEPKGTPQSHKKTTKSADLMCNDAPATPLASPAMAEGIVPMDPPSTSSANTPTTKDKDAEKTTAEEKPPSTKDTSIPASDSLPPGSPDYKNSCRSKPPYSYATLIAEAINSTEEKRLTLAGIYKYISANYSFYRYCGNSWQVMY